MRLFTLLSIILSCFYCTAQEVDEKLCAKIEVRVDKFDGDTTYTTPYKPGYMDLIHFVKTNGITFMSLKAYGSTLNVGKEGVIILLADGTKIEKPEAKIDADVNTSTSGGWDYSAFVRLDDSDIEKLTKSTVTDFRLYIYDSKVLPKKAALYQQYLKCLVLR